MIFSEIATERLPIRAFYPSDWGVEEYRLKYLDSLRSNYERKIEGLVSTLASIQAQRASQDTSVAVSPTADAEHASASNDFSTSSPRESRTLKRTHSRASLSTPNDENRSPQSLQSSQSLYKSRISASEIKGLKNAKLLKALRDVEKTLGSMEVEEQQRMNEVF